MIFPIFTCFLLTFQRPSPIPAKRGLLKFLKYAQILPQHHKETDVEPLQTPRHVTLVTYGHKHVFLDVLAASLRRYGLLWPSNVDVRHFDGQQFVNLRLNGGRDLSLKKDKDAMTLENACRRLGLAPVDESFVPEPWDWLRKTRDMVEVRFVYFLLF